MEGSGYVEGWNGRSRYRIKDRIRKLTVGEHNIRETFEDLYKVDTEEQVTVNMCGLDVGRRCNYFREESLSSSVSVCVCMCE